MKKATHVTASEWQRAYEESLPRGEQAGRVVFASAVQSLEGDLHVAVLRLSYWRAKDRARVARQRFGTNPSLHPVSSSATHFAHLAVLLERAEAKVKALRAELKTAGVKP
jgi:hypothetical protein